MSKSQNEYDAKMLSQESAVTLDCFLLTRQWRDTHDALELTFWALSNSGPVRVCIEREKAVCFVASNDALDLPEARRHPLALHTLDNRPVDGLYFRSQRDLVEARERTKSSGVRLYESDIKPSDRYLMERFITSAFTLRGTPRKQRGFTEFRNPTMKRSDYRAPLAAISIDIETEGLRGALYSIAAHANDEALVFLLSDQPVACDGFKVLCFPCFCFCST